MSKVSVWSQRIENIRNLEEPAVLIVRKASRGILKEEGCLGIFPASFNPPTKAHAALIKEARKRGNLDEILVLLDIEAMDKERIAAKFEDRLAMMEKVFGKDPRISIGLTNRGLFLQKIKPLRKDYPSPIEFSFIVGFDTILRVMDRKYYRNRKKSLDELFRQTKFLVANRGEQKGEAFVWFFDKRGNRPYRDQISFFSLPPRFSFFSSTLIRERIARGQPVDQWVPAVLLPFIEKRALYRTNLHDR